MGKIIKLRMLELITIVGSGVLTAKAINYANIFRGYKAYGGEYLIPVLGFIFIVLIEDRIETIMSRKRRCKR